LQFANKWGCEVHAFTTSDSKEAEARKLGAHFVHNTKQSFCCLAQPVIGMNSSRCRCMNSSRANRTIGDGSGGRLTARFRHIHSSKTSAINCCLVMPRNSHCFVSHSKCCELTTICTNSEDESGSSGGGPFSLFCTHWIALE
jgi:hypothetical protein